MQRAGIPGVLGGALADSERGGPEVGVEALRRIAGSAERRPWERGGSSVALQSPAPPPPAGASSAVGNAYVGQTGGSVGGSLHAIASRVPLTAVLLGGGGVGGGISGVFCPLRARGAAARMVLEGVFEDDPRLVVAIAE